MISHKDFIPDGSMGLLVNEVVAMRGPPPPELVDPAPRMLSGGDGRRGAAMWGVLEAEELVGLSGVGICEPPVSDENKVSRSSRDGWGFSLEKNRNSKRGREGENNGWKGKPGREVENRKQRTE